MPKMPTRIRIWEYLGLTGLLVALLVYLLPAKMLVVIAVAISISLIAFAKPLDAKINQLYSLAYHDNLTGLYNRTYGEKLLYGDSLKEPLSIIMGDVNQLKWVNDTLGHQTGDKLLQTIAKILSKSCPQGIVCRWGGDEFMVLLPETSLAEAEALCSEIQVQCEQASQDEFPVSIALGAGYSATPYYQQKQLLNRAERKMYHCKPAPRSSWGLAAK